MRKILTFEKNLSRIGCDIARNHCKERRLTRTVWSNDANRVALLQLEGNLFTNYYLAKFFRDILQLKQRHVVTS